MTFDYSAYQDPETPAAQANPVADPGPSNLVGPGQRVGGRPVQQQGNSPVAIAVLGIGAAAIAFSAGGALPGIQHEITANSAVSQRLAAEGLSTLSPAEIDKLIEFAIPLVDVDGNLTALQWEQVKPLKLQPGVYATGNSIYRIRMVGPGKVGEPNPVTGHGVGLLTPDQRATIIANAKKDGGVWQVVQSLGRGEQIPIVHNVRIARPNR